MISSGNKFDGELSSVCRVKITNHNHCTINSQKNRQQHKKQLLPRKVDLFRATQSKNIVLAGYSCSSCYFHKKMPQEVCRSVFNSLPSEMYRCNVYFLIAYFDHTAAEILGGKLTSNNLITLYLNLKGKNVLFVYFLYELLHQKRMF